MDKSIAGGYTSFRAFSDDEKKMFDAVLEGVMGSKHEPQAVATQVVSGLNFAFLCKSTILNVEGFYYSLVFIHKPLSEKGAPVLLEIKTVL